MIALTITLAILIAIALLRFGVSVEYDENGFVVRAIVGPVRLKLFPRVVKPEVSGKKKQPGRRGEKPVKETQEKKPGALQTLLDLLPAIKETLGRIRRRLLIKKLVIYLTAASADPYGTALMFGYANTATGIILPVLEQNFRVKRRDIRTTANFDADKQSIYINAAISIAVWEAVYIVMAILPSGLKVMKSLKGTTDRKGVQDNGENAVK